MAERSETNRQADAANDEERPTVTNEGLGKPALEPAVVDESDLKEGERRRSGQRVERKE